MTGELLTPVQMGEADRLTIEGGVPGIELMEVAGRAVADAACRMAGYDAGILVLAGPGNNGGDGFVAARLLKRRGYKVRVVLLPRGWEARGDAALALAAMKEAGVSPETLPQAQEEEALGAYLAAAGLVIDALFGAGLDRSLTGPIAAAVRQVNAAREAAGLLVLAVDLPSGVSGESGAILGTAVAADRTVTFFRAKPGHLLYPGRGLCGALEIADIGIKDAVLETVRPALFRNAPELWRCVWRPPGPEGHKYSRGHAVVISGPALATGAARLAAGAALRCGAGLVTVATPPSAALVNAAHLTAVMVRSFRGEKGLSELLADPRLNAVLLGPGAGVGEGTRALARACLAGPRAVVLDADALTSHADAPEELFALIAALNRSGAGEGAAPVVLTPHEGEFTRLFPDLSAAGLPSKVERARAAARRSGAVVLLKGGDTVIAEPGGRAAINDCAPPWLATAGSGDVLAGIVTGLLAQGMPGFEAACMAVWLHGQAGAEAGAALTAEDLEPALRAVLRQMVEEKR
ncbi:bifunctional NAD(P)H-hydrate repair enzyme [Stappia taiwanensis]|nr:NAD(P)H-hydrate dehydratase [Stappia taiwanensis]GGE97776.1 bifunctional NAD(P)H-hydrate repair enzyme [Stappia taiwanensis]